MDGPHAASSPRKSGIPPPRCPFARAAAHGDASTVSATDLKAASADLENEVNQILERQQKQIPPAAGGDPPRAAEAAEHLDEAEGAERFNGGIDRDTVADRIGSDAFPAVRVFLADDDHEDSHNHTQTPNGCGSHEVRVQEPRVGTPTLHVEDDSGEDLAATPKRARLPSPVREALKQKRQQEKENGTPPMAGERKFSVSSETSSAKEVRFEVQDEVHVLPPSVRMLAPELDVDVASIVARPVDRAKLYTDVHYRIAYVSQMLGFSEHDKALISGAAPLLAPHIPAIVDGVYKKLLRYDITAAAFAHRMENFHGKVTRDVAALDVHAETIQFRKNMLKRYLVCTMLSTEHAQTLENYLDWVALIHTKNTNKHSSINVEYVHLSALMGHLATALAEALAALPMPRDLRSTTQAAFVKLIYLQQDLFSLYYTRDSADVAAHVARKHGVVRPEPAVLGAERTRKLSLAAAAGGLASAVGFAFGWWMAARR